MKRLFSIFLLSLTLSPLSLQAQPVQVFRIAEGTLYTLPIAAGSDTRAVDLLLLSRKGVSQTIDGRLTAPKGATLSVTYSPVPSGSTVEAAFAGAAKYMIAETAAPGGDLLKTLVVGGANKSKRSKRAKSSTKFACNGRILAMALPRWREYYLIRFGLTFDSEEALCAKLFGDDTSGGGTTPAPSNITLNFSGAMAVNACANRSAYDYLIKVHIDLSKVTPDYFQSGFTMYSQIDLSSYTGGIKFKVKAVGDGKWHERLFLGEDPGFGTASGTFIQVAKGTKPIFKLTPRAKPDKHYGYKGMFLAIFRAAKYGTGGKATVFMSNGREIYGTCVRLISKDQYFNGYGS